MTTDYCNNLYQYSRSHTYEVKIGNLLLGTDHPIRIQSMGNIATTDIEGCVEQAIRIYEAGGEIVRFTACNVNEAECIGMIKEKLVGKGYLFPIVADVHFNPEAAFMAAKLVDKVRINPGNFAEKPSALKISQNRKSGTHKAEDHIRELFIPFLDICRQYGTAIRIGTNHGSLSQRIMDKYGDTPEGMVEATMEYLRICQEKQFSNVVVSLKSSNVRVMVYAYRLLVSKMKAEKMYYPLHLGVTEAGEGEDGRIRSAAGTGTLLADGLGETIRVSLTGAPEPEIPVAKIILEHVQGFSNHKPVKSASSSCYDPYSYEKRKTCHSNIAEKNFLPFVIGDLSNAEELNPALFGKLQNLDTPPDFVYTGSSFPHIIPQGLQIICDYLCWEPTDGLYPLFSLDDFVGQAKYSEKLNFIILDASDDVERIPRQFKNNPAFVFILTSSGAHPVIEMRSMINRLSEVGFFNPVAIHHTLPEPTPEKFDIRCTINSALLFIDGLADGIWLKNPFLPFTHAIHTSFSILQACRVRVTRTEYIACPSCGRTRFNLEKTLSLIKQNTGHLKGLKIGVMGCIVNGPGEMADADYGYVGEAPGKITLYKGKQVIKRNIDEKLAIDELIALIKNNGDWTEA